MIDMINDNYEEFHQKIFDKLSDYSYREQRYNLDFSIVIALCDENVDSSKLINIKRQTDELIILKDNLFCIVLDGASSASEVKAASHIQTEFLNMFGDKKLFIAVVTVQDYINHNDMIDSLFKVLKYSIVSNTHNIIVDKDLTLHNSKY